MKNNTIALLAGILIIISAASILVSPKSITFVTGFASSGNSYASFNMSEEVSVLVSENIDFGSGRVNSDAPQAILDSELGYHYNWFNITNISGPRPSPRWTNVIYDAGRDVFIMYGYLSYYQTPLSDANETWQFNYSSMVWTNLTATAGRPTFFDAFTPIYDSSINAVIMYRTSVFYKFNSSGQWELLNTTGEPPYPSRKDYAMAFDSRRNVSVLFGGRAPGGGLPYAGTWEFNASNNKWTNKSSANEPHARSYAAMAFDSNRNVSVLYSGSDGGLYFYDTWEYNGTGWTDVTERISGYPTGNGRTYPSMIYDSARKKIVLFGGDGTSWFNDAWEYDGAKWVNTANISVGRRTAIAFDSKNNKTLLFYGEGGTPTFFNDTWDYNATDMDAETSANGTWYFEKGFFYIENDGTVNISINFSADNNAEQFIGGTSPSFEIKGVAHEPNSCPDLNTTYANVPNSTETPKILCPMLKFGNVADIFRVPVRLVVPSDVAAGDKSATITFSATKT